MFCSSGDEDKHSFCVQMAKAINLTCPAHFAYDEENRSTAASRWDIWIEDFELFLIGSGVSDPDQSLATLLYVVGPEARQIYASKKKNTDKYDDVKRILKDHFAPLKNEDYEILKFSQLRQRDSESIDDFVVRLRSEVKKCGYDEATCEKEVRRQLIAGCKSEKLKESVIEKSGISLDDLLARVRARDLLNSQGKGVIETAHDIIKTEPIGAVTDKPTSSNKNFKDKPMFGTYNRRRNDDRNRMRVVR